MTEPRRFGKYSKVIRERDDAIEALARQLERIVAEKGAEIARLRAEIEELRQYAPSPDPFHS